jgi:hypothetical protein
MTKSIRVFAGVLAVALLSSWAHRVQAIPITVMLFYGAPLTQKVLVSGADTLPFGDLLTPIRRPTRPNLDGRKFLSVALFIDPADNPAGNGTPTARLTPEMARQHARLYFATTTEPAVMMVTDFAKQMSGVPPPDEAGMYRSPHVISPEAIAVLKRHGIPTGPGK